MNNSIYRFALAGTSFLALAAAASAFAPAPQMPFSTDDVRALAFLNDPDAPSTVLSADLDGDFREEVIALQGGTLTIFFAAVSFDSVSRGLAPQGITEVAVLPGQGSDGRDILVTVGSAGVQTWEYNLDTDQLDGTLLAIPGWEAVTRIAVGDIDMDGSVTDIAGISADGYSVFIAANITATPVNYPTMPSTEQVFDLAFLDAYPNATAARELAMLRESSVLVMDALGTLNSIPLSPMTTGRVAVLESGGGSRDSLAVAALEVARTDYNLTVVAVGDIEPSISLNLSDLVGISAADIDQDGDIDLAISRSAGGDLMILPASDNGVNTYHSPTLPGSYVSTEGGDAGSLGEPLLSDLNRDGLPDLVYPRWMNGNSYLLMYKNVPTTTAATVGFEVMSSMLKLADDDPMSTNDLLFNDNLLLQLPAEDTSLPSLECIVWLHEYEANGIVQQATRIDHILSPSWNQTGSERQLVKLTLDETMDGLFPQILIPGTTDQYFDHDLNYSVTGDMFFYEFRAVALTTDTSSPTGYRVTNAGESFLVAHLSLEKDLNGSTSVLDDYWPKWAANGDVGYSSPFFKYSDNETDTAALADKLEMLDLADYVEEHFPGSAVSVRVVDPGEFPIPHVPSVAGGGRPKTTTAVAPLPNVDESPI